MSPKRLLLPLLAGSAHFTLHVCLHKSCFRFLISLHNITMSINHQRNTHLLKLSIGGLNLNSCCTYWLFNMALRYFWTLLFGLTLAAHLCGVLSSRWPCLQLTQTKQQMAMLISLFLFLHFAVIMSCIRMEYRHKVHSHWIWVCQKKHYNLLGLEIKKKIVTSQLIW